ncbi:uncharacterized protein LOC125767255 [Anopheles funestus]|uniref:uncharacterized protein LOC125767255 n=1 Tax=Anopheles funestus TaxID=62324 RepID=UPI0020C6275D|nr:uncharacterized protein LOC125767255 [Anopheles funestus]
MDQHLKGVNNRMEAGRKRSLDSSSSSEDSDSTEEEHNTVCGAVKESCYIDEHTKNERKKRKLREFRNFLMPKNAIAALHELQGTGITEYIVTKHGTQTKAKIVINNVNTNEGTAEYASKAAATDKLDSLPVDVETEAIEYVEKEDIPIELLASFALHKLFTEWEAEGFKMPIIKMSREKSTTRAEELAPEEAENGLIRTPLRPKLIKTVADLPPNANRYHPTALFTYMRPKVLYDDLDSNNDRLHPEFTVRLQSDGHDFIGKARSKKLARKAAAIDACKQLFGVVFDESFDIDACCKVSLQIPVHTTSSRKGWGLYQDWF